MYPLLYRLDRYPFDDITSLVEKEVKKAGMAYINLLPSLKNKKEQDWWVYPTDQHPNEKVHAVSADILYRYIKTSL